MKKPSTDRKQPQSPTELARTRLDAIGGGYSPDSDRVVADLPPQR
jgi:hypothetical protein